jgi:hypothetical protein
MSGYQLGGMSSFVSLARCCLGLRIIRTFLLLYVQLKLGVEPVESVNKMRSMMSLNKQSPFSLPDGDSTDGENNRPAKRRLLSRKRKQSEYAGARLHQRHISICLITKSLISMGV